MAIPFYGLDGLDAYPEWKEIANGDSKEVISVEDGHEYEATFTIKKRPAGVTVGGKHSGKGAGKAMVATWTIRPGPGGASPWDII